MIVLFGSSKRRGATTPPPVNTVLPAITGTPTDGQVLTASAGTWTGSPTLYVYSWFRDGVFHHGGVGATTYTLGPTDVGKIITVSVAATNAGGTTSATSEGVGPVASPFSPATVPNCELYFDVDGDGVTAGAYSDAGTTPCAAGDLAYRFWDFSGNNRHLDQPTSGSRTQFRRDSGKGVAVHNNNVQPGVHTSPNFLDSSFDTGITVVLVYEPAASAFDLYSRDGGQKLYQAVSPGGNLESLYWFNLNLSPGYSFRALSQQSRRIEIYRYDGSERRVRVASPSTDDEVVTSVTGNLGLTGGWTVGDASYFPRGVSCAGAIYKRKITDAETDDLVTFFGTKYFLTLNPGPHASGSGTSVVVCDGDSRMGSTGGATPCPTQLATLLGGTFAVNNIAVGGAQSGHLIVDYSRTFGVADSLFDPTATKCIYTLMIGINEYPGQADQIFTRIKELCLRRRYTGFQVVIATIPPSGTVTGADATNIGAVNTLIRNRYTEFADALADFAGDSRLSNPADPTYYNADTLHFTTAGNGVEASLLYNAIQTL